MAKLTVSERVRIALDEITMTGKSRRNSEAMLFEIRKWQEAKAYADKQLKAAWATAQAEGVVDDDDKMRELGEGQHIVNEAGKFSVTAKVTSGGSTFKPETAVAKMVSRFKVTAERAERLIEDSKEENTARLEKRVLEAGQ